MDPVDRIDRIDGPRATSDERRLRVGCIVQARLDSTRLCHKVLREIPPGSGQLVLTRVLWAALLARRVAEVCLTTPDPALAFLARSWSEGLVWTQLWRGDRDPLAEYATLARARRYDLVVRLTADCPMITGEIIDAGIAAFLAEELDLYYNGLDGADVEVCTRDVLERANAEATLPEDREHVTLWIKRELWYREGKPSPAERAWYKSLDTPEDFRLIADRLAGAGRGPH
jgi:spore coat polysaccharide biosynthesis protein SpsF (cytidylyltransferase family)